MVKKKKFNKIFATIIIVLLLVLLLIAIQPFFAALVEAAVLFVIFNPLFTWLIKRAKFPKWAAASSVILISLLVIVVPIIFILTLSVGEVSSLVTVAQQNGNLVKFVQDKIQNPQIQGPLEEIATKFVQFAQNVIVGAASKLTETLVAMFILYFTLFYLLVSQKQIKKYCQRIIPFNKKNRSRLLLEFSRITTATTYSTGLLALIQGTILGLLFFFLGIPSALFWGIVGTVLSVIPVLGTFLVWFPAAVIYGVLGQWTTVALLVAGGLFIGLIDNFIRPGLNKKFGEIHPMISMLGVFIGLPMFGMIGIILGPLLLSYFFLMVKMFEEEYL